MFWRLEGTGVGAGGGAARTNTALGGGADAQAVRTIMAPKAANPRRRPGNLAKFMRGPLSSEAALPDNRWTCGGPALVFLAAAASQAAPLE